MAETATGAGPMKELMSRKHPKALKSLSCSEHSKNKLLCPKHWTQAGVARGEMRGDWVSYLRLFLLWRGLDSLYEAVGITESLRGDETHHSGSYLGTDVRGPGGIFWSL